jgi:hypothetical protein
VNKITENFEDCKFYTGLSMSPEVMMAVLRYREDGTPYMSFWKHGLEEQTL